VPCPPPTSISATQTGNHKVKLDGTLNLVDNDLLWPAAVKQFRHCCGWNRSQAAPTFFRKA